MASPHAQVAQPASGAQPVSFLFPITWNFLAEPLGARIKEKPEEKLALTPIPVIVPTPPVEPTPISAVRAPLAALEVTAPRPRSTDSWEMVIPKTSRPVPHRESETSETDRGFQTLGAFPRKPVKGLSAAMKLGLKMLLAMAISAVLFFTIANTTRLPTPFAAAASEAGPPLEVGLAGWIPGFATPGRSQGGRVSVLRGSQKLTDFRLEFRGQIVSKAFGWVVRAKDAKNFYVMKLEIVKPIPESKGVLTRFAVIDGQEESRVQVPLAMPLRPNAVYNIRVDALGSTLTTWFQGQQIDRWVAPQIQAGGVGLYTELGDRGTLEGPMAVSTLRAKAPSHRGPMPSLASGAASARAISDRVEAARALHASGRTQEALELLSGPGDFSQDVYTLRGDLQLQLGQLHEALGSYSTVIAFERHNVYALRHLAVCLCRLARRLRSNYWAAWRRRNSFMSGYWSWSQGPRRRLAI